jgi:amino acid transporter
MHIGIPQSYLETVYKSHVHIGLSQIDAAERANRTALVYGKTATDQMKTAMKKESGMYIYIYIYIIECICTCLHGCVCMSLLCVFTHSLMCILYSLCVLFLIIFRRIKTDAISSQHKKRIKDVLSLKDNTEASRRDTKISADKNVRAVYVVYLFTFMNSYIFLYIYMSIYIYVYTYIYMYTYICIYTYIYICIYIYVYIHIYTHVCTYKCIYIRMYICIQVRKREMTAQDLENKKASMLAIGDV